MKVVAINGSPRKGGNTSILLRKALETIEAEGIETELVELAGQRIRGCIACRKCFENRNRRCVLTDDCVNDLIAKLDEADGMLFGSPTYFADVTAEMKAVIDRVGYVASANGKMYRRKAGAGVIAVRRAGAIHAFDSINHFFLINEMMVVGSNYWNVGIGLAPGEVNEDEAGLTTMEVLGRHMAWLLNATADRREE